MNPLLCLAMVGGLLAAPVARSADQAVYRHDAAGRLTNIVVSAAQAPIIYQPPQDASGSPGLGFALSVTAGGTGPLGYQWFFQGGSLAGATNPTLFVPSFSLANTGLYAVAVFNATGAVTSAPPARVYLDLDYDGLPDDWEQAYFGGIFAQNPADDADSDGVSNRDEFIDGTNPTSSSSRFYRLRFFAPGGQVLVNPNLARYAPGTAVTLTANPDSPFRFTGWGGDLTGTNNPVVITMNGDRSISAGFGMTTLGEAVDLPALNWVTGGNGLWLGLTNITHDGTDAAKSGAILDAQSTWLEVTNVQPGEGAGSFWWKVSSEASYDFLRFYLNGVEQPGAISGQLDWSQKQFYLPAGTNVLRWTYSKDGSQSVGADSGWVDQVQFSVASNPLADDDSDGLPDLWEIRYFGSLSLEGAADYDGDGVSNLDEFRDGTNPSSASSLRPRLAVIVVGDGSVLRNPDQPNYDYGQTVTLTPVPGPGATFAGWSGALAGGANPATMTLNGNKTVTARFVPAYGLGASLDQPALDWQTSGSGLWLGQTNVTHDGVDAAQSGVIGDNGQTSLELTNVTTVDGTLRFWWKVSSEGGYDFARLFVNGFEIAGRISGDVDWQEKVAWLPAGTNVLRWTYSKDGSASVGADAAWVDQVQFTDGFDRTDADTDGLPDVWEMTYFNSLAPSGSDDADNDGVSNRDEFLDGTNPVSNGSYLPRLVVSIVGNGSVVRSPDLPKYSQGQAVTVTAIPGEGSSFVGWGGALSGLANPATLVMNASQTLIARFTRFVPLKESLDNMALTWSTGGSLPWTGQTALSRDGEDAGQSGGVTHGQQSWMETTVLGPGNATFWWKVSSESGYDFLKFAIDGAEQSRRISGEIDWEQQTYDLTAGVHQLRWTYAKDASVSAGIDAGWVDQITVSGASFSLRAPVLSPVGGFQFMLTGASGLRLVVESSTNLNTWTPISTNQLTGTNQLFIDNRASGIPRRFYRAVLAP